MHRKEVECMKSFYFTNAAIKRRTRLLLDTETVNSFQEVIGML